MIDVMAKQFEVDFIVVDKVDEYTHRTALQVKHETLI